MNIVALYIIGRPKMIGSLMLKNAGTMPSLPTVLICLDLDIRQRSAMAKVAPEPPMAM